MTIWHTHHLLPRHAGGTDDPSNLVKVNKAMHAFLHRLRYLETGDLYDLAAANQLSGGWSVEKARREAMKEGWRRSPKAQQATLENIRRYNEETPREILRANARKGNAAQPLDGKKKGGATTGSLPYWNNGLNNKRSKECPGEGYVLGKLPHGPMPKVECPHCGELISNNKLNPHLRRSH
jgi:hypothetical protein